MKKSIARLLLLSSFLLAAIAASADYKFQVPENRSIVVVNEDASVTVRYAITFSNEGQPIDVIDVGLPDAKYDIAQVKADLDGVPLTDIRKSTELTYGVEVHLGDKAIPAGSKGTLNLRAVCKDRVYEDSQDKAYASLEFSPTWYGEEYTSGTTHLVCEFVLPEGIAQDEPRYHKTHVTSSRFENNRVIYTWDMPEGSPSQQYTFGASFPRRVMQKVVEGPGPVALFFGAIVSFVSNSVPCLCFGVFIGFFVLMFINKYRRRLKYLPASVGMEGSEVRRGLTVPEAAVLMEEKVDKVMALVLFGMVRKGLLKVVSQTPLKLEVAPSQEPATPYEQDLAKAVKDDGTISESEAAEVLTDLIKTVQDKMKGFSRKKSILYYKDIMRKAWDQVGQEDYSQAFEWLLLDKDFAQTATARFPGGNMPLPVWWMPIYSGHDYGGGGSAPAGPPLAGGVSAQGPVAAANSIVSSVESFSHSVVNSVPGLASKVTQATNPVPVSSGGGSSGGGCACACAGCACACAGGGR